MLQSFPPLCSGELALNGTRASYIFLSLLTPMLMKKRDSSCKSQRVKISSGEVNSHPVGVWFGLWCSITLSRGAAERARLGQEVTMQPGAGGATYCFSGNKNFECWNCISWDYMGSPPCMSALGCCQTRFGAVCPFDVTLYGRLCACICHCLRCCLLVRGQHFCSSVTFWFLVQVKKCLSV